MKGGRCSSLHRAVLVTYLMYELGWIKISAVCVSPPLVSLCLAVLIGV